MVGCFWIGPQCWPQCWARSSWEAWVCHRLTVNSLSGWTHLPFWPLDCYRNQEDSKSLCKQTESGGDDGDGGDGGGDDLAGLVPYVGAVIRDTRANYTAPGKVRRAPQRTLCC